MKNYLIISSVLMSMVILMSIPLTRIYLDKIEIEEDCKKNGIPGISLIGADGSITLGEIMINTDLNIVVIFKVNRGTVSKPAIDYHSQVSYGIFGLGKKNIINEVMN